MSSGCKILKGNDPLGQDTSVNTQNFTRVQFIGNI